MAIQVMQRLQNIKSSVEKYLYDGLVTGDSLKVAFPGVPFESRDLASWCEVQWLPDETLFAYRQADTSSNHGREVTIILQVMCFARRYSSAGAVVNKWTLMALRDKVSGRLPMGKEINVYNYADDDALTDTLFIEDVSGERVEADTSKSKTLGALDAYAFTVVLRYTAPEGATA